MCPRRCDAAQFQLKTLLRQAEADLTMEFVNTRISLDGIYSYCYIAGRSDRLPHHRESARIPLGGVSAFASYHGRPQ